jgi:hypothetical protein
MCHLKLVMLCPTMALVRFIYTPGRVHQALLALSLWFRSKCAYPVANRRRVTLVAPLWFLAAQALLRVQQPVLCLCLRKNFRFLAAQALLHAAEM